MYCGYCGTENEDGMRFCINCGKPMYYPDEEASQGKDEQNDIAPDKKIFYEYAQLSKRIKEGDELAFSEMYEKSSRLVYATCYGILRNSEDANDAMQDTYMAVYKHISSLQDDMKFFGWLKRIAATRSLNLYKTRHGDVSYDDTIGSEEDIRGDDNLETLPDSLIMVETKRNILDGIMKKELSDVQYQTILLNYFDEFPVEMIAKLMDCPEGTVKTRLKSSRVKIKEGIEKYEEETGDRLHAIVPIPFLMRFFMENAKKLDIPKLNVMPGAPAAPASPAAPVAGTAATAASSGAAGTTAATAAAAAAKTGFLASTAGKAIAVVIAAATLTAGGFGVKYLIDRNSDDGRDSRSKRERRDRYEDETEETEETETEAVPEPVTIDPFDYIDVVFEGYSPSVTANIVIHSDMPCDGISFTPEKFEGLEDGEIITVKVNQEIEGYVFETMTRDYVVKGEEDTRWKDAYLEVARSITPADFNAGGSSIPVKFNLIYVDDDDIPELVCGYDAGDGFDIFLCIYTVRDGQAVRLEDSDGPLIRVGRIMIYYFEKENLICTGGSIDEAGASIRSQYWHINSDKTGVDVESVISYAYDPNKYDTAWDAEDAGEIGDRRYEYLYSPATRERRELTDEDRERVGIGREDHIEIKTPLSLSDLEARLSS